MAGKRVSWDPKKAASNIKDHEGVTFEEASTVLDDDHANWLLDQAYSEDRFNVIGMSSSARVLFVVTVALEDDSYRIISARKATRHERKLY